MILLETFPVLIESEPRLYFLILTRFLHAVSTSRVQGSNHQPNVAATGRLQVNSPTEVSGNPSAIPGSRTTPTITFKLERLFLAAVRQVRSKVPVAKCFIIGNESRPSGINPIAIRRTVAIWFKSKADQGQKVAGRFPC
jgi:hypothetical protein